MKNKENNELIEKIIAMQDKFMPALDKLEAEGNLPADLRKAMADVKEWTKEFDHQDGDDKELRPWPIHDFAKELHKHMDDFDHQTKQWVREYGDFAERLPYNADETLGR